MKLKQDKTYEHMYWVVWPDGYTDFFNISWAREQLRRIEDENNKSS